MSSSVKTPEQERAHCREVARVLHDTLAVVPPVTDAQVEWFQASAAREVCAACAVLADVIERERAAVRGAFEQTRLCELQAYKRADEYAAETLTSEEDRRAALRERDDLAARVKAMLPYVRENNVRPQLLRRPKNAPLGEGSTEWYLHCAFCDGEWRLENTEQHAPGCIAASTETPP